MKLSTTIAGIVAAALFAGIGAVRLLRNEQGMLQPEGLGVPINPPAAVPPGAILPADPNALGAQYFDINPPLMYGKLSKSESNDQAWPPSPPKGPPLAMNMPGMRPLTLLDAKGGEYAQANEGQGQ